MSMGGGALAMGITSDLQLFLGAVQCQDRPNIDLCSIANPIRLEDHNSQGVEQVALDRPVEKAGSIGRRAPAVTEEFLRIFVDLEGDTSLRQAGLGLLELDVHDRFHIPRREDTLGGGKVSTPAQKAIRNPPNKWVLTKMTTSSIRLMNSGAR